MSAAVCGSGSKRSPSSPVSKKLHCSPSSPPVCLSAPSLIDQLRAVFPHMNDQVLERALQECGNDIDAAVKRLHELCLGSPNENPAASEEFDLDAATTITPSDSDSSIHFIVASDSSSLEDTATSAPPQQRPQGASSGAPVPPGRG